MRCAVCKKDIVAGQEFALIKKRVAYTTKGLREGESYITDRVAKGWKLDVIVCVGCMNDPRGIHWNL